MSSLKLVRLMMNGSGYIAPEYGLYGRFSEKSDVFSFGVIILEIISGRRNKGSYPLNGSLNLLGFVSTSIPVVVCDQIHSSLIHYRHGNFGPKEDVVSW